MRTATLTKVKSDDDGTVSRLVTDQGLECYVLELPQRDNKPGRSCIPAGDYLCEWDNSPSRGWCYHVRNVPARDHILIHAANLAGDVDKGKVAQLEGCLAPGMALGLFCEGTKVGKAMLAVDQWGVSASVVALKRLEDHFGQGPFTLKITR